ncbi:solute carrier family 35 member F6 isoform X2 [Hyalella azteca]|uniref:Solute carrier family 35 member F6 isoform X2 n=1 Tax=Hyalella azteca TaxID=294128 RepID=A0A8B7NPV8_HYAAZ|nr:solute carrier family 35 member F6 isoform X2 [Hyalella azteca]
MTWTAKSMTFAIMMVIFGTINTMSTKWADRMESINSEGELAHFNHPFFQADAMFLGELSCMAAFYIMRCVARSRRRRRNNAELSLPEEQTNFPPLIFYVPAFCDMVATSTMYVGLTLTYASSFQMLRGSVIVFTGLLSVAFLNQKLRYFNWLGIALVIVGLVVVGVSDFLGDNTEDFDTNGIITGDLLIIAAQVVTATQMVVEQRFLTKHTVPALLAVGWEGLFGFITLTILLVPFYYIPAGMFSGNPRGTLEDPIDAFIQLSNNPMLVVAVLGNVISIAFFNFAGVSVTKELSATTRMVLDSVRTLVVWLTSLALKWQPFHYLQPIGFIVLVLGMFIYNDVLILPYMRSKGWVNDALPEEERIVDGAEEPACDATSRPSTPDALIIKKASLSSSDGSASGVKS